MHTPNHEPLSQEFDVLLTAEERDVLARPNVPDDVRAEIFEALERRRESEREHAQAEDKSDSDRPEI